MSSFTTTDYHHRSAVSHKPSSLPADLAQQPSRTHKYVTTLSGTTTQQKRHPRQAKKNTTFYYGIQALFCSPPGRQQLRVYFCFASGHACMRVQFFEISTHTPSLPFTSGLLGECLLLVLLRCRNIAHPRSARSLGRAIYASESSRRPPCHACMYVPGGRRTEPHATALPPCPPRRQRATAHRDNEETPKPVDSKMFFGIFASTRFTSQWFRPAVQSSASKKKNATRQRREDKRNIAKSRNRLMANGRLPCPLPSRSLLPQPPTSFLCFPSVVPPPRPVPCPPKPRASLVPSSQPQRSAQRDEDSGGHILLERSGKKQAEKDKPATSTFAKHHHVRLLVG